MSIVTHIMIGAAAGSLTPNAIVGGGAGFVSHIILDLIPHYDPPVVKKKHKSWLDHLVLWGLLTADFLLGLTVLFLVKDYPPMFWGGLIGGLVDLDAFFFHKLETVGIHIHNEKSHWHQQTTILKGLFNQGVVTLAGLLVIFFKIS